MDKKERGAASVYKPLQKQAEKVRLRIRRLRRNAKDLTARLFCGRGNFPLQFLSRYRHALSLSPLKIQIRASPPLP